MNDGPLLCGATVSKWVFEGKVKGTEDFTDGLENTAKAFIGMLEGKNFGKSIVRIAKDY
ncbi:hypothetical protein [uncultured Mucilaginibacter sp.]|uniref:hypothetical protein n=1 Tax=uncultured Mucilaginibacter sp. TaxID=797541 RepID=UPI002617E1F6|nr:hypothetical protein [uncultured Mucilaginibacter sp.]